MHDVETGLYYNRFRYYSPESGAYINQDPIGLAGNNPNIYAYTKDVNAWVDPFGLTVTRLSAGTTKYHPKRVSQRLDHHYEDLVRDVTGGQSGDIKLNGKDYEMDSITDDALIQCKRSLSATDNPDTWLKQKNKNQIKNTVEMARKAGKRAEIWFKYGAHPKVIKYITDKGAHYVAGLNKNKKSC